MISFLKKLSKHNDKLWFDANRPQYESARDEFAALVDDVIQRFGKHDPSIAALKAKECLFRINRDVRFSKDKSPYKTNLGASINSGGKKSSLAGYYIHVEPGASFVGGGIWMPMPDVLAKARQEIDYNLDEFSSVINAPAFRKQYGQLYMGKDVSLARVPKGYEPSNPAADYLKLKSYIAMRSVSDEDIKAGKLNLIAVEAFKALQPLIRFLNAGM